MIHWRNRGAGLLRCGDKDVEVTPIWAAIVDRLLQSPGQAVSTERLIAHVYRGASEPTDAAAVIQVSVSKMRKKGVPIRPRGRGSFDGYWFDRDDIGPKPGDRYVIDGCPGVFTVTRFVEAPIIEFDNDKLEMKSMTAPYDEVLKKLRRVP